MFYGIFIRLYHSPKEHEPPHFHAYYNEYESIIDIIQGEVIRGNIPSGQLKLILAWTEIHRSELIEDWNLCMSGKNPKQIEPLK